MKATAALRKLLSLQRWELGSSSLGFHGANCRRHENFVSVFLEVVGVIAE